MKNVYNPSINRIYFAVFLLICSVGLTINKDSHSSSDVQLLPSYQDIKNRELPTGNSRFSVFINY